MKKLLNTLYITTQSAYLAKEGQSVIVRVEKETKLRIPIHSLGSIVCFGSVSCSPFLMGFCAQNNVTISFLTEYGRFLARVEGPTSGNVLLRKEQYHQAGTPHLAVALVQSFILGKIINARNNLQRALRDHSEKINREKIIHAINQIKALIQTIPRTQELEKLRGIEGNSSKEYFNCFNDLIISQKPDFVFSGRNRRPPLDNVNCLLSFIYTILLHDCRSALETVGLDPQAGFLHRFRPGRPSLALDVMEEFRAPIADRLVLSLINRQQIQSKHFRHCENGAITLKEEPRKQLLIAYQKRKQETIEHPYLQEKIPIGLIFQIQAQLLARHLRGDLDTYPPFIWK